MGDTKNNLVFKPMPWVGEALCAAKNIPVDMFFPERGRNNNIAKAQQICVGCPVRQQCFDYGMENDERGIWGGTTGRERRQLRMRQITVEQLAVNTNVTTQKGNGDAATG